MTQTRTVQFATIPQEEVLCEGCVQPLDAITIAQCGRGPRVCFPCVQARAKTVATGGRCKCGSRRRENPEVHRVHSRTWHSCLRCLGTTRQLS